MKFNFEETKIYIRPGATVLRFNNEKSPGRNQLPSGSHSGFRIHSNECVKRHRKRSRFKVQTADKLSKAVSTW